MLHAHISWCVANERVHPSARLLLNSLPTWSIQTLGETSHDDVIKWKHFLRYWPIVRGIHRSPVNSQHKGQWRGALMFSLICDWINGWVNNREAGDLRRYRAHYDVTVMGNDIVVGNIGLLIASNGWNSWISSLYGKIIIQFLGIHFFYGFPEPIALLAAWTHLRPLSPWRFSGKLIIEFTSN